MTALMLASVSGHMGTIRALIDAGADYDPEPSITTCQVTPLMIAAQHGNDALVRLYLDKGVSANKATPKTGKTCTVTVTKIWLVEVGQGSCFLFS